MKDNGGSYAEDDVDASCPVVLRFFSCGFVSSSYFAGTMTFPKPLIISVITFDTSGSSFKHFLLKMCGGVLTLNALH